MTWCSGRSEHGMGADFLHGRGGERSGGRRTCRPRRRLASGNELHTTSAAAPGLDRSACDGGSAPSFATASRGRVRRTSHPRSAAPACSTDLAAYENVLAPSANDGLPTGLSRSKVNLDNSRGRKYHAPIQRHSCKGTIVLRLAGGYPVGQNRYPFGALTP